MRLIFEPEVAYYATLRATESELKTILTLGEKIEQRIEPVSYTHLDVYKRQV